MPRVELPSWQDQLSDEVHELETLVRLDDPLALDQARNMLRMLRSYETRVRQIALRPDPYDDPLSQKETRLGYGTERRGSPFNQRL